MSLELLSYAGYTGTIDLSLKRNDIDKNVTVGVIVKDFLPTPQSQADPIKYLGLDLDFKMKPIIGSVISNGPADNSNLKANDVIRKIGGAKINYASDIRNTILTLPNQIVLFDIYRGNDLIQLPVKIGSAIDDNGNE